MPLAGRRALGLHYEAAGAGPPVLLALPLSTGPSGGRPLVDALAPHHTVITYDQRGTGRSRLADSDAAAAAPMETHGRDLLELMDALEIAQTCLLCHSTGCGIGLSMAAAEPARVSHLVLAAPWSHADAHLQSVQTLRKAAARALDPEQYARFNAALLFPPDYRRSNEIAFTRIARAACPQDADAIASRLDAILDFDARPLWSRVRCPTLILTARDDQLMPPWFGEETARGIRRAALIQLDGGGHMFLETRAEEVAAAVLDFLGGRPRDDGRS